MGCGCAKSTPVWSLTRATFGWGDNHLIGCKKIDDPRQREESGHPKKYQDRPKVPPRSRDGPGYGDILWGPSGTCGGSKCCSSLIDSRNPRSRVWTTKAAAKTGGAPTTRLAATSETCKEEDAAFPDIGRKKNFCGIKGLG